LEADLIKTRLAVEVSAIQDNEWLHHRPQDKSHQCVDEWLRTTPAPRQEAKQLRFERPRERSRTPSQNRNKIDQLAETLGKRIRQVD
jgi:hypothetical protein